MGENRECVRLYLPGHANLRIAVLGGGHGLSNMLRGLKCYAKNITAIVSVADDGGGSGQLREDLGMLPPGDIRNCILALANTEPTMEKLINYRFSEGRLAGQSFGNLFLAALNGISNGFDEAVRRMGDVLAITGCVLPVTNQCVNLEAEFENGVRVLGESKIAAAKKDNDCDIRRIRLVPEHPQALPECIDAISQADLVVMGPGSLYTSIIPNLLVSGITQALGKSHALKILVMNIMTQDGETEGYTGADHVRALMRHCGSHIVDVCVANDAPIGPAQRAIYQKEDSEPIALHRAEIEQMGIAVREFPLVDSGELVRHAPDKLARALMEVWREFRFC
ncbi:MAG: YvcK family protein [Oscillospiraceae bacterium]|nr:YvcK family protein [Oscillospiraceae bacterium]